MKNDLVACLLYLSLLIRSVKRKKRKKNHKKGEGGKKRKKKKEEKEKIERKRSYTWKGKEKKNETNNIGICA